MALVPGILLAQCKSTWRSKLDLEYLDETSVTKRMQMLRKGNAIGAKLDQFGDYASKESLGEVHMAGYLHRDVARNTDGSFSHPRYLDNAERKRRITHVWSQKLNEKVYGRGAKKEVIQHRLVFSMSAELHASCVKAELSPEQVLHQSMKRIMRRFQEKFHPDDAIAYAYGFHHDTDNLHVHVALCPRTKKGFYVGFSTPKNKAHNTSQQKDHIGFVRRCCESENRKWEEFLGNPERLAQLQQQRHGERFVFHSRQKPRPQQPDIFSLELNRRYRELTALQKRLHRIEQEHRQLRLEARAASFFRWKTTSIWRGTSVIKSVLSSGNYASNFSAYVKLISGIFESSKLTRPIMPIQSPNTPLKPSRSATNSAAFVEVAGFTFRLRDVDGFHQMLGETDDQITGTTVYFKSYTAMMRDPKGELFQYLRSELL